ncbi:MAG: hypothetical protein AB1894_13830 [Chloroflexota bacterium]
MQTRTPPWLALLLIVVLLAGCTSTTPSPDPTLQARVERFSQTVTARAEGQGQGLQSVQTLAAQATQTSQALQATRDAEDAAAQASRYATATYQAPVLAELPLYGLDGSNGQLAWMHPPVDLDIEGYRSEEFANEYAQVTARDFILVADITWDTKYGASGCGFALRSDGEAQTANQYLVMYSRSANGHAYFLAQAAGKVANFRNFYANWLDPQFKWENGSTNRLAVSAIGPKLSVYSNYTLIGEIDTTQPPPALPDLPAAPVKPTRPGGKLSSAALKAYQDELLRYQMQLEVFNQLANTVKRYHSSAVKAYQTSDTAFEEGFVGFFAFAYSGYVKCRFDNAWLWLIE